MSQNVILLVDDDPVFSRFTENVLTEGGMKVIPAFNKAEGLELFERNHPNCVILDIFLPDGNGVDLINPMRASAPKVPII
ncbi:MAG: response regulator, partial [Deltaproteobacteria bacterium]